MSEHSARLPGGPWLRRLPADHSVLCGPGRRAQLRLESSASGSSQASGIALADRHSASRSHARIRQAYSNGEAASLACEQFFGSFSQHRFKEVFLQHRDYDFDDEFANRHAPKLCLERKLSQLRVTSHIRSTEQSESA